MRQRCKSHTIPPPLCISQCHLLIFFSSFFKGHLLRVQLQLYTLSSVSRDGPVRSGMDLPRVNAGPVTFLSLRESAREPPHAAAAAAAAARWERGLPSSASQPSTTRFYLSHSPRAADPAVNPFGPHSSFGLLGHGSNLTPSHQGRNPFLNLCHRPLKYFKPKIFKTHKIPKNGEQPKKIHWILF